MNYFVTAIDTDSGKTFVSAILCEALGADYWKPVQAGQPRDSATVRELISNPGSRIHPERYYLKTPASPHAAAKLDNVRIELGDFVVPRSANDLIIEGAGGCLVPLNDHDFVIDLATRFNTEIILVADLYLGSINHTLLTIRELQRRQLRIKGIIFNGEANPQSEEIILLHAGLPCLLRIAREERLDNNIIKKYAKQLLINWYG